MSFHKRHITKDGIIANINDLDRYFSADALMMDSWSSRFYKDLDKKDRKLIKELYEKNKFHSFHTDDFKQLSSLSECLISLLNKPTWEPVLFTIWRLGITVEEKEVGHFPSLLEKSINGIIDYYDEIKKEA